MNEIIYYYYLKNSKEDELNVDDYEDKELIEIIQEDILEKKTDGEFLFEVYPKNVRMILWAHDRKHLIDKIKNEKIRWKEFANQNCEANSLLFVQFMEMSSLFRENGKIFSLTLQG